MWEAKTSLSPQKGAPILLWSPMVASYGFSLSHGPRGPHGWSEAAFDASRAFLSGDFPFCCYIVLPCKNEPTLDVDFGFFVVWGCHLVTIVTGLIVDLGG